jgi:hypothetical protein
LHKRITSAVKRVEFISYRTSYIIIVNHRCHIVVLNVHVPTEDRTEKTYPPAVLYSSDTFFFFLVYISVRG